jgi:hypothetical protein
VKRFCFLSPFFISPAKQEQILQSCKMRDKNRLIFCAPFFASPAERDDFVFAPPFLFFTLAQQAYFVFCGGFGVVFCFHFLRPFCVLFFRFLGLGWW